MNTGFLKRGISCFALGLISLILLTGCPDPTVPADELTGSETGAETGAAADTSAPEISITIAGTMIENSISNDAYVFSKTIKDRSSADLDVTIKNDGDAALSIKSISCTSASVFVLDITDIPADTAIPAGESKEFSLGFTPDTIGDFSSIITITSDDADEATYSFKVSGTGVGIPGEIDKTFGTNGAALYPSSVGITINEMHVQADGKIFATGWVYRTGSLWDTKLLRYNSDGTLDTGFGNSGSIEISKTGHDEGYAVVTDSSGNIYLASGNTTDYSLTVYKYDSSGNAVTSFGTSGAVAVNDTGSEGLGTGAGLAIDSDGRLIVAMSQDTVVSNDGTGCGYSIVLYAYNKDTGAKDTAWGDSGRCVDTVVNNYGDSTLDDMQIDSEGRIVIAGTRWETGSDQDIYVWRFTAGGAVDTSFGTILDETRMGYYHYEKASTHEVSEEFALDSSDNIYVSCGIDGGDTNGDAALLKLDSSGDLDTGFGTNGITVLDGADMVSYAGSEDEGTSAVMLNGSIYLLGRTYGPAEDEDPDCGFIAKYSTGGDLDTTFGENGISILLGVAGGYADGSTNDCFEDIAVSADNMLVILGESAETETDSTVTTITQVWP